MVLEAILTDRQPNEKLQCLYGSSGSGNLMSNNFRKTAVLPKKSGIVNPSFTAKYCTNKFWGPHLYLNFSGRLLKIFSREILVGSGRKSLLHKCKENFKRGFGEVNYVNKILLCVALV